MAERDSEHSVHALLLPYPSQGHINPILQFGKRLAAHRGVRRTLAATRFVLSNSQPCPGDAIRIAAISDGCDRGGRSEAGAAAAYLSRLESAGSETVDQLLRSEAEQGRPVDVVVYDAFLPWAQGAARRARRSTRRCAPWTCCTRTCWPPDTVPAGEGGAAGAGGAACPTPTDRPADVLR